MRRLWVRRDDGSPTDDDHDQWNTLQHPPRTLSVAIIGNHRGKRGGSRLDFYSFENAGGITACARAGATVGMFIHQEGVDVSSFMEKYVILFGEENLVFLCMPLSKGERISDVCVRTISKTGTLAAQPVIIVSLTP